MAYTLAVNEWISIPDSWKLKIITDADCRKFLFHSIRPVGWKVALEQMIGPHHNETQTIEPFQTSLIMGVEPGYVRCITIASSVVDNRKLRWAREYETFSHLGQAKFWYLSKTNLFQSDFEVFNGPTPIDLSGSG